MYIHGLDCGWMAHAFIRNRFLLEREADLKRILASNAGSVYIDTEKGGDVPAPAPQAATGPRTSYREELANAKQVKREADRVIHALLNDARMGRQLRIEQLEPVVLQMTESILRNPGTLVSLCRMREADVATFEHSVSSCALMIMFGQHLRLDRGILHEAGVGGLLHDIGKMRVPNHILNKPGRLTEAESVIMRDHVRLGLETLGRTPGLSDLVLHVAAEHHERLDGSGYPRRLRGFQISPLGRMATIIDVYDAHDRPAHLPPRDRAGGGAAAALPEPPGLVRPGYGAALHPGHRHLSGGLAGPAGEQPAGRGDGAERRRAAVPGGAGGL